MIDAWITRGLMKPLQVRGEVKRCEKTDWLIVKTRTGEVRRHRIGSTAFFTERAAVRRWHGALDKAMHNSYAVQHGLVPPAVGIPRVYGGKRLMGPK